MAIYGICSDFIEIDEESWFTPYGAHPTTHTRDPLFAPYRLGSEGPDCEWCLFGLVHEWWYVGVRSLEVPNPVRLMPAGLQGEVYI